MERNVNLFQQKNRAADSAAIKAGQLGGAHKAVPALGEPQTKAAVKREAKAKAKAIAAKALAAPEKGKGKGKGKGKDGGDRPTPAY
eukprot:3873232-Heterocapsa_arctica.AAC.1